MIYCHNLTFNFMITFPSVALQEPKEFKIHSVYFAMLQKFLCVSL